MACVLDSLTAIANRESSRGFATLCVVAPEGAPKQKRATRALFCFGADYGARTRHLHLGKVALYQMS